MSQKQVGLKGQLGRPETRGVVKVYPCSYGGIPVMWAGATIANGFAFLSGTEGWDVETMTVAPSIERQAWMCLEKVRDRLDEMGTSIPNIVKMRIYVTDTDAFYREVWGPGRSFWRFYNQYLPDTPKEFPPISLVQVGALPRKDMKIAISAIAAAPKTAPKNQSVVKYYHLEDEPWASGAIANRFAFLSLVDGYDFHKLTMADSFQQQMWDALENVSARLLDMGTSLDNVVMCTAINTNMSEYFREPSKYRRKFEREKYLSVRKLSFSATLLEMPALERIDAMMAFDVFAAIP